MFGTETFLGKIMRDTRPENLDVGYVQYAPEQESREMPTNLLIR
jgi:hypothetical protein